jgi:hypothetical protein
MVRARCESGSSGGAAANIVQSMGTTALSAEGISSSML